MRSVRRTALIWMTLLLTLVGLVGAGTAYVIDLTESGILLDGQLRQIALNAGTGPVFRNAALSGHNRDDDVLVQIWRSGNATPQSSNPAIRIPQQPDAGFATQTVGGESWRIFQTSEGATVVEAAQRVRVRTELAQTAALEAAVPILITIPLGWLVIGWGLQRVLGRLSALAAEIATRGAESRHPIPVADIPVEVAPLVEAMNVLIERLQHSLEQQKQFLSDAAHELRTPLAALRLQIENLQFPDDETLLPELRRGAARASGLVDQLLRLARYEADSAKSRPERLDAVALVLDCVADHVAVADNKRVDLGVALTEPAQLLGVERELRLLFGNLIENAVRYTPPGGIVDVSVRARDGHLEVEVADTGCGIREEALPRIFDRFFRAAPQDVEGTGLGLAICKAIAERHGFSIALRNRDGGGLVATVTGPLLADLAREPSAAPGVEEVGAGVELGHGA